jgi:hypothetical protein
MYFTSIYVLLTWGLFTLHQQQGHVATESYHSSWQIWINCSSVFVSASIIIIYPVFNDRLDNDHQRQFLCKQFILKIVELEEFSLKFNGYFLDVVRQGIQSRSRRQRSGIRGQGSSWTSSKPCGQCQLPTFQELTSEDVFSTLLKVCSRTSRTMPLESQGRVLITVCIRS